MEKKMEYYIQGAQSARMMTPRANRRARRLFKQAIDIDSGFARAHGYLSYSLLLAYLHGWKDDTLREDDDITTEKFLECAQTAHDRGSDDYENHWSLAAANIYSNNYVEGMEHYKEALTMAETQAIPENLSFLRVEEADAKIFNGTRSDIEDAVATVLNEMKTPDYPTSCLWALGWGYYELGSFDKSTERHYCRLALEALRQIPKPHALIKKNILAVYVALNMTTEATELARELRAELPQGYRVSLIENRWPYGDSQKGRQDRLIEHLRSAGLPS